MFAPAPGSTLRATTEGALPKLTEERLYLMRLLALRMGFAKGVSKLMALR